MPAVLQIESRRLGSPGGYADAHERGKHEMVGEDVQESKLGG